VIDKTNAQLPSKMHAPSPMPRPNIARMLQEDPTEAIHSELIMPIFQRYFSTVERKDLGGGVAYQIMHNNPPLYSGSPTADRSVDFLLQLDEFHTTMGDVPSLFSYFVGRPRKELFDGSHDEQLNAFEQEELEREQKASECGGWYGRERL